MITYNDIANSVTWSKPGKSMQPWITPNKKLFMFIGERLEEDTLFNSICDYLQCQKDAIATQKIHFGIVFIEDSQNFFQIGKSDAIDKILFCPSLDLMRTNGAFKKTLWQYMGNLGMI